MTKTWCVGGRHYSNTNNISEYEKRNPKNKKLDKNINENVIFVVIKKHKFLQVND